MAEEHEHLVMQQQHQQPAQPAPTAAQQQPPTFQFQFGAGFNAPGFPHQHQQSTLGRRSNPNPFSGIKLGQRFPQSYNISSNHQQLSSSTPSQTRHDSGPSVGPPPPSGQTNGTTLAGSTPAPATTSAEGNSINGRGTAGLSVPATSAASASKFANGSVSAAGAALSLSSSSGVPSAFMRTTANRAGPSTPERDHGPDSCAAPDSTETDAGHLDFEGSSAWKSNAPVPPAPATAAHPQTTAAASQGTTAPPGAQHQILMPTAPRFYERAMSPSGGGSSSSTSSTSSMFVPQPRSVMQQSRRGGAVGPGPQKLSASSSSSALFRGASLDPGMRGPATGTAVGPGTTPGASNRGVDAARAGAGAKNRGWSLERSDLERGILTPRLILPHNALTSPAGARSPERTLQVGIGASASGSTAYCAESPGASGGGPSSTGGPGCTSSPSYCRPTLPDLTSGSSAKNGLAGPGSSSSSCLALAGNRSPPPVRTSAGGSLLAPTPGRGSSGGPLQVQSLDALGRSSTSSAGGGSSSCLSSSLTAGGAAGGGGASSSCSLSYKLPFSSSVSGGGSVAGGNATTMNSSRAAASTLQSGQKEKQQQQVPCSSSPDDSRLAGSGSLQLYGGAPLSFSTHTTGGSGGVARTSTSSGTSTRTVSQTINVSARPAAAGGGATAEAQELALSPQVSNGTTGSDDVDHHHHLHDGGGHSGSAASRRRREFMESTASTQGKKRKKEKRRKNKEHKSGKDRSRSASASRRPERASSRSKHSTEEVLLPKRSSPVAAPGVTPSENRGSAQQEQKQDMSLTGGLGRVGTIRDKFQVSNLNQNTPTSASVSGAAVSPTTTDFPKKPPHLDRKPSEQHPMSSSRLDQDHAAKALRELICTLDESVKLKFREVCSTYNVSAADRDRFVNSASFSSTGEVDASSSSSYDIFLRDYFIHNSRFQLGLCALLEDKLKENAFLKAAASTMKASTCTGPRRTSNPVIGSSASASSSTTPRFLTDMRRNGKSRPPTGEVPGRVANSNLPANNSTREPRSAGVERSSKASASTAAQSASPSPTDGGENSLLTPPLLHESAAGMTTTSTASKTEILPGSPTAEYVQAVAYSRPPPSRRPGAGGVGTPTPVSALAMNGKIPPPAAPPDRPPIVPLSPTGQPIPIEQPASNGGTAFSSSTSSCVTTRRMGARIAEATKLFQQSQRAGSPAAVSSRRTGGQLPRTLGGAACSGANKRRSAPEGAPRSPPREDEQEHEKEVEVPLRKHLLSARSSSSSRRERERDAVLVDRQEEERTKFTDQERGHRAAVLSRQLPVSVSPNANAAAENDIPIGRDADVLCPSGVPACASRSSTSSSRGRAPPPHVAAFSCGRRDGDVDVDDTSPSPSPGAKLKISAKLVTAAECARLEDLDTSRDKVARSAERPVDREVGGGSFVGLSPKGGGVLTEKDMLDLTQPIPSPKKQSPPPRRKSLQPTSRQMENEAKMEIDEQAKFDSDTAGPAAACSSAAASSGPPALPEGRLPPPAGLDISSLFNAALFGTNSSPAAGAVLPQDSPFTQAHLTLHSQSQLLPASTLARLGAVTSASGASTGDLASSTTTPILSGGSETAAVGGSCASSGASPPSGSACATSSTLQEADDIDLNRVPAAGELSIAVRDTMFHMLEEQELQGYRVKLTVPENVTSGTVLRFDFAGRSHEVSAPADAAPGEEIMYRVPKRPALEKNCFYAALKHRNLAIPDRRNICDQVRMPANFHRDEDKARTRSGGGDSDELAKIQRAEDLLQDPTFVQRQDLYKWLRGRNMDPLLAFTPEETDEQLLLAEEDST
mmetsp:Transcript_14408/g.36004  ORF Transcript_14408/g.36004 Transcript_14408/m.36004 type:complete len:1807 (+) Transcript_14408:407-5827(+)